MKPYTSKFKEQQDFKNIPFTKFKKDIENDLF